MFSLPVLDPVSCFVLPPEDKLVLQNLFNPKFGYNETAVWKVLYPSAALSVEDRAMQCGPFVCFYAEAIAEGWSLLEMPDVNQYRKHIAATLIGKCSPFPDKRKKKCYRCKEVMSDNDACDFCKRMAHQKCFTEVILRGRSYNTCS